MHRSVSGVVRGASVVTVVKEPASTEAAAAGKGRLTAAAIACRYEIYHAQLFSYLLQSVSSVKRFLRSRDRLVDESERVHCRCVWGRVASAAVHMKLRSRGNTECGEFSFIDKICPHGLKARGAHTPRRLASSHSLLIDGGWMRVVSTIRRTPSVI